MDFAHATVTGPSEIASPTQMDIHLDNLRKIALSILQAVEVNLIEIIISFGLVARS